MSGEHTVDEIVTNFLLDTCGLRPLLSRHAVQAARCCVRVAIKHPLGGVLSGVFLPGQSRLHNLVNRQRTLPDEQTDRRTDGRIAMSLNVPPYRGQRQNNG